MSKSPFVQILLVGAGGFVGAAFRYVLSGVVQRIDPAGVFPYGTLAVNVAGCLLIGILSGLADTRQLIGPGTRLFILIGLLGGFTTFSTFAYETLGLASSGENLWAMANVLASVGFCLAGVWLGYAIGSAR